MSQDIRKLNLTRETVRNLTDQDLAGADGAVTSLHCTPVVRTLPLDQCLAPISLLLTNILSCPGV